MKLNSTERRQALSGYTSEAIDIWSEDISETYEKIPEDVIICFRNFLIILTNSIIILFWNKILNILNISFFQCFSNLFFDLIKIVLLLLILNSLEIFLRILLNIIHKLLYIHYSNKKIKLYIEADEENQFKEEVKNSNSNYNDIIIRKNFISLQKLFNQSIRHNQKIFIFGFILIFLSLSIIPIIIITNSTNSIINQTIYTILVSFVLVIFNNMFTKSNQTAKEFYVGLMNSYKEIYKNK
jgi:hypothetical protein